MARRRSRKNAFHGHPRLHRWAALLGHRRGRKSRRTRRNAGSIAASVKSIPSAATKAFSKKALMDSGALLAGSATTTFVSEHLTTHFPVLSSHKLLSVITRLAMAGVVGKLVAPKVPYIKGYASYVFAGGVLSGVIEGLRMVIPEHYFPKTGLGEDLGEDMEGMGWGDTLRGMSDWFVGPYNASWALPNTDGGYDRDPYTNQRMGQGLHLQHQGMMAHPAMQQHMGSFLHVGQPQVHLRGMADSLHMNQPVSGTGHQYHPHHPMHGLANMALAEEMEGLV